MEKLYEEIVNSKKEIKNAIEASEVRLLMKIETFSEKIKKLEKENTELKEKIETLERNGKKNNIVVFGLTKKFEDLSVDNICNQLNKILDVEINISDINNLYRLGKAENSPIKIEFLSTFTKINILRNCKKLKGTNITISADLTKTQQERIKILRNFLTKLRSTGENRCYIKGERLYSNNTVYTVEDILEIEQSSESSQVINSAPQTPSRPDFLLKTVSEEKKVVLDEEKNKEKEEEENLKKQEEKEEDKDKKKTSANKPTVNTAPTAQSETNPNLEIIGGHDANITDYPWQISLQHRQSHFCGGFLISEKWVVTAAHCFIEGYSDIENLLVRAGSSDWSRGGKLHFLNRYITHPQFNISTADYDIALLELDPPLILNQSTRPARLPEAGQVIPDNAQLTITGWGATYAADYVVYDLQEVTVPTVNRNVCQSALANDTITNNMFCAGLIGVGGKDSCDGDSGGPAMINGQVVGIVSWGYSCADPRYPGVYARVSAFRDWIHQNTGI
ncbi:unnamed protein product [Phaedon cochleariae]|uniref:Peptidase S1 domain-containing protein n=1 Tax=Phaedon cochleariae TaxID=80249 RepID=A0A9N9X4M1_PHACE|nr:unnamed protein product [Phaedon cochleariae]